MDSKSSRISGCRRYQIPRALRNGHPSSNSTEPPNLIRGKNSQNNTPRPREGNSKGAQKLPRLWRLVIPRHWGLWKRKASPTANPIIAHNKEKGTQKKPNLGEGGVSKGQVIMIRGLETKPTEYRDKTKQKYGTLTK